MRHDHYSGQQHVTTRKSPITRATVCVAAAMIAGGLVSQKANATTLTWDGLDHTANGSTGGPGTWDTATTTNWTNASAAEVQWTDTTGTDTATFGGTAGAVAVAGGGVTANKLQFNLTGYTFSGGTITLAGTTPTIAFGSIASTTFANNVSGANLTFTAATSGFLALNGDGTGITGTTTLNLGGGAVGMTSANTATGASVTPVNGLGASTLKFTSTGQVNYRNNGDNTNSTQTLNFGNNFDIAGGNATVNVGRQSTSTTSDNKTFSFGKVTFDSANSLTFAGAIGSAPSDRITFNNVVLDANGSIGLSAANGVASIGAITESGGSRSFTVNTATSVSGSTLVLNAAGTYTGATNYQMGTVREGVTNALPTGTTLTLGVASGAATLDLNGKNQTLGGLATAGTAANQTITNSATTASVLTYSGGSSTFGGIIKDGGTTAKELTLTVSSGTLGLTGTNTYVGGTNVNGGTLNVGAAGALGTTGTIAFGGGTLQYTTAVDYSSRILGSSSAIKIDSFGQSVSYANALGSSNAGGLTLNDTATVAGNLKLSGANAYTGTTTITRGTLALASLATITGSPTINLNGGALDSSADTGFAITSASGPTIAQTLMGQGTMTVASGGLAINGTLSVGQSDHITGTASKLTFGGGTVTLGGTTRLDLFGYTSGGLNSSNDQLAGAINYGNGTLVVSDETGTASTSFTVGSSWDLFTSGGSNAFANAFGSSDANLPTLSSGLGWNFAAGTGVLSVVAVPEPASVAGIALGLGMLLRRRRQSAAI